jgi:hypothetical protein
LVSVYVCVYVYVYVFTCVHILLHDTCKYAPPLHKCTTSSHDYCTHVLCCNNDDSQLVCDTMRCRYGTSSAVLARKLVHYSEPTNKQASKQACTNARMYCAVLLLPPLPLLLLLPLYSMRVSGYR